jgi:hypothetical protein
MDIAFGDCLSAGSFCYALILVDCSTWYNWAFGLKNLLLDAILDAIQLFCVAAGSLAQCFYCDCDLKLFGTAISELGWEFQFLVPISGTPIRSGVPIPFLIPKIPVGKFFSNSAVEKLRNWNFDSEIWNSKKNKRRNSMHLISCMMSIMIGQPVGLTMSNHMDVGTIPGKGNLSA